MCLLLRDDESNEDRQVSLSHESLMGHTNHLLLSWFGPWMSVSLWGDSGAHLQMFSWTSVSHHETEDELIINIESVANISSVKTFLVPVLKLAVMHPSTQTLKLINFSLVWSLSSLCFFFCIIKCIFSIFFCSCIFTFLQNIILYLNNHPVTEVKGCWFVLFLYVYWDFPHTQKLVMEFHLVLCLAQVLFVLQRCSLGKNTRRNCRNSHFDTDEVW